jgi:antitoxin (DNA-binding transcriptional repressor) of toxin-antitoxin stability system
MYIVHVKKYTVARARQRFAEVLDSAESGEDVVIERRGISFTVRPIVAARHRRRAPRIEIVDPQVEAGAWSWSWSEAGGVAITKPRGGRTP